METFFMQNELIIQLVEFKRFEKSANNNDDSLNVGRIVGYLDVNNFIKLFNFLMDLPQDALDANPRVPKSSKITEQIIATLENSSREFFHLKTKGLLLSASDCDTTLDRNRIRLSFYANGFTRDGILDGGHNTFAIIKYILLKALKEDDSLKKIKSIETLIEKWNNHRAEIESLLFGEMEEFQFLIPIDIIFPVGIKDSNDLKEDWIDAHFEITQARNNNAALTESTKSNHEGYYFDLMEVLKPDLESRVIWKANHTEDGKRKIAVEDVIALSLIPLSKVKGDKDEDLVGSMTKIYSARASCEKTFKTILIDHGDIDPKDIEAGVKKIRNKKILSALKLLPDFLRGYDFLYKNFRDYYRTSGGELARINNVESYGLANSKLKKPPLTKFTDQECIYKISDAYIYPLIVALKELIQYNEETQEYYLIQPIETYLTENHKDLFQIINGAFKQHKNVPDQIGKDKTLYDTLEIIVRHGAQNYILLNEKQ